MGSVFPNCLLLVMMMITNLFLIFVLTAIILKLFQSFVLNSFPVVSSKYTAGLRDLRHASVAYVFCIIAHLFLSLSTHLFPGCDFQPPRLSKLSAVLGCFPSVISIVSCFLVILVDDIS